MAADILGSVRGSLKGAGERGGELAEVIADRVEEALESAEARGRRVRKDLERRWRQVDRVGRENAFLMALGALGFGLLVGWLIGRDRR
ncbi:MAG TPA: hypothetical protein PLB02_14320 [Thermoanaerobaculia bacterium]|jgi:hypothetical protein|nr:hypothetical protein [Thermoanaerobaculia bacterium]HQR68561.1 hypothetical protein [Thermoanaerobaculia bacterium]